MADVARRLKIPHATVRNYYQGRLPAADVLIKIANETGVSLNWLLLGTGNKYSDETTRVDIGRFLEERIGQIVDQRLNTRDQVKSNYKDYSGAFDIEAAVLRFDDPQAVMGEWFHYEHREYPQDFGVVFFGGWETFSLAEKVEAVVDAKRVIDRSLLSLKK